METILRSIFISYSKKDSRRIEGLVTLLKALGHPVFVDKESIRAGKRWRKVLYNALDNYDSLVVFWTRNSDDSKWVSREVEYFSRSRGEDAEIMPIKADETPLSPLLREYQAVNFIPLISELLELKRKREKEGKSHREIEKEILSKLEEEGISLNTRQRRSVFAFLAPFGKLSWLTSPILTISGLWALLKTTIGQYLSIHFGTALSIVLLSTVLCKTVDVSSATTLVTDLYEKFINTPNKDIIPLLDVTSEPISSVVTEGDPFTVHWSTKNAESVTRDGVAVGLEGSKTFNPEATTSYNFIATSETGNKKQVSVMVAVKALPSFSKDEIKKVQYDLNKCLNMSLIVDGAIGSKTMGAIRKYREQKGLPIEDGLTQNLIDLLSKDSETPNQEPCFYSEPIYEPSLTLRTEPRSREVQAGDAFTINWKTKYAETVTMNGYRLSAIGTKTYYPTRTTIFHFAASSRAGQKEESVKVIVEPIPEPLLRITTEPSSREVKAGDKFTINWETEYADTVTINGDEVSADGVHAFNPEETTTFDIVASSRAGQKEESVKVIVEPIPEPLLRITTEPSSHEVKAGDKFTINWETEYADTVTINGDEVSADGVHAFNPEETTTFDIVASSRAGQKEESVKVIVEPIPEPLLRITTEPSSREVKAGDKFTINWETEYADTVTINGDEVSADGVHAFNPEETTTFDIVASSRAGQKEESVKVIVEPIPEPLLRITTEPSSREVKAGDKFTINWETEYADTVTINGDEVSADGVHAFNPEETTTFDIVASSRAGQKEESVKVIVEPIPEPLLRITTEPSSREVKAGDKFTINWETEHADAVTINGDEVSADGVHAFNPEETTTFDIVASSRAGQKEESVIVIVNDPELYPQMEVYIEPTSGEVEPGETFILSWNGGDKAVEVMLNDEEVEIEGKRELQIDATKIYTFVATSETGHIDEEVVKIIVR